MREELTETDWTEMFDPCKDDINECWDRFQKPVNNMIDKHVPKKCVQGANVNLSLWR